MLSRIARFVIFIALIWLSLQYAFAQPPVDQQWLARYDGQVHGDDVPSALVVDEIGNLIVTGVAQNLTSGRDWATVKYDTSGAVVWVNVFNGPAGGSDSATCLTLGSGGEIFVAGSSEGPGTGQDYRIVKYDAWGAQLWSAQYDGEAHLDDRACSTILDEVGNLYVTGRSRGADTGVDILTLKLDPQGDTLWTIRYTGLGDSLDLPAGIGLDAVGNIYVAGTSWSDSTAFDWILIKYSPQGEELWVERYNSPGNWDDQAFDLAVASDGKVAVTGTAWIDEHNAFDACTILYSATGDLLWTGTYNGIQWGEVDDFGQKVKIDQWGNVFVTGSCFAGSFGTNALTIKYNASGDSIWTRTWDSPVHSDDGFDCQLTLDNFGNAYVGGSCLGEDYDYDYITLKYNPAGTEIWEIRYEGIQGRGFDRMQALALSPDEQTIFVTGFSSSEGMGLDYASLKYRQYNQPPVITAWEPVDLDSVVQGDTLTFRLFATDPDSDDISMQWVRDGQIVGAGTSLTASFDSLGLTRLSASVSDGQSSDSVVWDITVVEPNAVIIQDPISPLTFQLFPPQPNPFNSSTTISYELPALSYVSLTVYDTAGRLITILVQGWRQAGIHQALFDGSGLASGIYLVRFETGNQSQVRKVALMK